MKGSQRWQMHWQRTKHFGHWFWKVCFAILFAVWDVSVFWAKLVFKFYKVKGGLEKRLNVGMLSFCVWETAFQPSNNNDDLLVFLAFLESYNNHTSHCFFECIFFGNCAFNNFLPTAYTLQICFNTPLLFCVLLSLRAQ